MLDADQPPVTFSGMDVTRLERYGELRFAIANMTASPSRSFFAQTYANRLLNSLESSERLSEILGQVQLSTPFPGGTLGTQFNQVAKVIRARRELEEERAVFYVSLRGFDSHNSLQETVRDKFDQVDEALKSFVSEMEAQGIWKSVVLLTASDFARTLSSNGAGTDHAWGGNYYLLGGGLKGGQMLGKFPISLGEDSDVNVGRNGRFLPTTPWEAPWYGLAEWFGVGVDRMADILPNAANFPEKTLFRASQLFT